MFKKPCHATQCWPVMGLVSHVYAFSGSLVLEQRKPQQSTLITSGAKFSLRNFKTKCRRTTYWYTVQVLTKWAAGPFVVFKTPVFTMSEFKSLSLVGEDAEVHSPAFRCHPRSRLRCTAPFLFSARVENLEIGEEGSARLVAARSDALISVRIVRELFPTSFGSLSKVRKMLTLRFGPLALDLCVSDSSAQFF